MPLSETGSTPVAVGNRNVSRRKLNAAPTYGRSHT